MVGGWQPGGEEPGAGDEGDGAGGLVRPEAKGVQGEVTPHSTPRSKSRSPRVQANRFSRLLQFQQQLTEEHGLPTSRLQMRTRLEEVTTLSPSSPSSPCLRQSQRQEEEMQEVGEGRDLLGEFERIGADARLLPLATPVRVLPVKGGEGGGQENQTGGRCGATQTPTPLIMPASGQENNSSRRCSEAVGGGVEAVTSTPSPVW